MNDKKRESRLRTITHVLNVFRCNFGRNLEWQQVMETTWAAKMLHLPQTDKELIDIMNVMCTKHYDYPNTVGLSDYLEEIKKYLGENGKGSLHGNTYTYCPDCEYQSGIVKVCSVYIKNGEEYRKPTSTRCICEGATAKYPNMISWSELEEQGQLMHRTGQINLLHFYRTSRDMPTMPESIRNPEFHAKVLERLEEDKGKLFNPYLWAVQRMVKTAGLTLDDNGNVVGQVHVVPDQPKVRPNVPPPPVQQYQQPQQPKTTMSDEEFWRNH